MLGPWGDRVGRRISHRPGITLTIALSVIVGAASCALVGSGHQAPAASACTRQTAGTSVVSGPPAAVAAGVAQALFGCAPSVVVANAASAADVAAAVPLAEQAHAPLLLSPLASSTANTASYLSGTAGAARARLTSSLSTAALQEINDLHPRSVLAVGLTTTELSAVMPGARVTTEPSGLPGMSPPKPLSHVVVLVPAGRSAASMAASATAEAAGATAVPVSGYDPRGDPAAITALASIRPRQVIAAGAGFGPANRLAARLAVAQTGVQLPRGGQLVVPMHRIVALYGHPGTPSLGALGQQGLQASVTRAKRAAANYNALSKVPVVPAFEIIAAVATSAPGPEGTYSYETPVAALRPWVAAATKAGMYVILDLQPGRANFLAEAKVYQPLLELPNVGLALDPEWKLQPGQMPLQQIGSVSIAEVNSVVSWLAQLTAQYRLPQKLLELHEFRIGEIQNEQLLDTHNDDLAIVMNMDGEGTPAMKQQTWDAVTSTAPSGVNFGWKNFYVKDDPMLSPSQTMSNTPGPVVISYQ
jgi:hypothetical protein